MDVAHVSVVPHILKMSDLKSLRELVIWICGSFNVEVGEDLAHEMREREVWIELDLDLPQPLACDLVTMLILADVTKTVSRKAASSMQPSQYTTGFCLPP